jgi:hypothetical protein
MPNTADIAELREWFSYDPDTGLITRLKTTRGGNGKLGRVAGTRHLTGRSSQHDIQISFRGRFFRAHRIAWALHYGEWPDKQIDHVNGIRVDNRIANLRIATTSQNHANVGPPSNNTSGIKGVSWRKKRRKWRAEIIVKGRYIYLGSFKSQVRAVMARLEAEVKYHGDFMWAGPPEETSQCLI